MTSVMTNNLKKAIAKNVWGRHHREYNLTSILSMHVLGVCVCVHMQGHTHAPQHMYKARKLESLFSLYHGGSRDLGQAGKLCIQHLYPVSYLASPDLTLLKTKSGSYRWLLQLGDSTDVLLPVKNIQWFDSLTALWSGGFYTKFSKKGDASPPSYRPLGWLVRLRSKQAQTCLIVECEFYHEAR